MFFRLLNIKKSQRRKEGNETVKAMKKMLAAALAAAIAVTCVLPAYAAGSDTTGDKPANTVGAVTEPSASGVTATVDTSKDGTAKLDKVQKTNKKTVKVSQKVEVDGVKYTVTTITADAFAECEQMTDVTIPSTVTKIAQGAFRGAKNLKNAEIKGKPVVKKGAFKGAAKLTKLTFTNAPTFEKAAFKGTKLNKIVVSKKAVFAKNAFKGADTKDTVIKVSGKMTQKQYNQLVKDLKKAGFKGKVKVKIKK